MLILCCGSLDRGDAGAGPLVARHLHAVDVAARTLSGEAYNLIEAWREGADVIVVAPVVSGATPGTVTVWDGHTAQLEGRWFRCSGHFLSVPEAIGISRKAGTLPRRLRIYGIEGRYFTAGSRASAPILRAAEKVADDIAAEVAIGLPL